MSLGYVRDLNGQLFPIYPIYIESPIGSPGVHNAYIDTGFTGEIALPTRIREDLGLEYARTTSTEFGNSRVESVPSYSATVFWDNDWREVTVLETGDRPLIGMELLRGNSVCFDTFDRGPIEIQPLKPATD